MAKRQIQFTQEQIEILLKNPNVESISSDYDVEQVANKVKSLINEDARYRNNNAVSLKR